MLPKSFRLERIAAVSEPSTGMMVTSNVRLLRPLGEGGMGSVWVAEHLSLRTNVVVKFMAEDLAKSPEALARFSREAAAASQVKSPHVVQMFDHGVLDTGAPYIVMELLEGRDLEQQLRASGPLQPREVVAIVAQLARALAKAHERGIMHRDIKPSNVFLCDAGGGELFVKLLDFGIAKGPGSGGGVGIVGSTTRTGSFIGSPFYMSPEQVIGAKTIDFKTDLWSLGVVAFEALTGDKPFFAETVGALALKIHRDPIPIPSEVKPGLAPAVDAWFARACAREPAERYASAKDMAEALAVAVTGEFIAPGLRVDSVPTPRHHAGFDTTQAASPVASTKRSGIDARSETGAGVGLVASGMIPVSSRGKWIVLGGIAVVAVGVGFAVPRMMAGPVVAASATAAVVTPALTPALTPPPTLTLAPAPAPAPASAPAPATATATAPATRIAKGKPPPSATPSATAPATTATVAKPPPGSDDDIK
jgi:serine/threonine-protein kinase